MRTIYEDNGDGLYMVEGDKMWSDLERLDAGTGKADILTPLENWEINRPGVPLTDGDLDGLEIIAEVDDNEVTLYEDRMGSNGRLYFGVRGVRED